MLITFEKNKTDNSKFPPHTHAQSTVYFMNLTSTLSLPSQYYSRPYSSTCQIYILYWPSTYPPPLFVKADNRKKKWPLSIKQSEWAIGHCVFCCSFPPNSLDKWSSVANTNRVQPCPLIYIFSFFFYAIHSPAVMTI